MYYLGPIDISNGEEPTDVKERTRQRARERYAQMDKQKKDELLKKRREAYKQKKALQSMPVVTGESQDSSSARHQLRSTPVVTGALYEPSSLDTCRRIIWFRMHEAT